MVSLSRNDIVCPVAGSLLGLWLAGAALLTTLVALLSLAIMNDPIPSQDLAVMDWVRGWHLPGLAGFFQVVSGRTSKWGARDWAWQGRHSCFCWASLVSLSPSPSWAQWWVSLPSLGTTLWEKSWGEQGLSQINRCPAFPADTCLAAPSSSVSRVS